LSYPGGYVAGFAPNALGQPEQVTDFASAATYHPNGALKGYTFGNGIVRTIDLNARGLPWRIFDRVTNGPVHLDLRHTYDANGNVMAITDHTPGGVQGRSMAYDGLDRLTSTSAPLMFGQASYAYDPLDNLREANLDARQYRYQYDAAWRLHQIRTPSNQLVWNLGYDSRGNLTSKGSTGYTFDQANRLTEFSATASQSSSYFYDAHGRRAAMATPAGGLFTLYTRDGKLRGGFDATQNARLRQVYLGNTLVGTRHEPTDGTPTRTYHHTDLLGSPVRETDQNRALVSQIHYSPYGEALNTTVDGPGYTGHRMDGHSKLVYMQQRYYDPVIGRFLSVDPVGVSGANGGNFNRYWYANNNPYKYTDPDGRCAVKESRQKCIHAENFDSSRSSGKSAQGTAESDRSVREQKGVVRTRPGASAETLGSLNRQDDGSLKVELVEGATTDRTKTADTAAGSPPLNALAVVHGHISESVADDRATRGDADAVKILGIPNYAVAQDGRVSVHEVVDGRYQIRMVQGKMTPAEIKHFRGLVNSRQEDFYDR